MTKVILLISCIFVFLNLTAQNSSDSHLKLWFTFNDTSTSPTVNDDSGNNYYGTLKSGASASDIGGIDGVLDLGSSNGFIDLGAKFGSDLLSNLEDFTIATYLCIPSNVDISGAGNFVFSFGNSEKIATDANGCMFFSAKNTRYAISPTNWTREQGIATDKQMDKGEWEHLAVTFNSGTNTAKIYINGKVVASSSNIQMTPKQLGETTYNFIGKSSYALNGDAYLKNTLLDDFRIYDVALTGNEVDELTSLLPDLNKAWYGIQIDQLFESLSFKDGDTINANLELPVSFNGINITWSSSDPEIISASGSVTRPVNGSAPQTVLITANASKSGATFEKSFHITVIPILSDAESVAFDADHLNPEGSLNNLRSSLNLQSVGFEGSIISWSSSILDILANDGELLYLPEKGTGKIHVVLTATISKGNNSQTRTFNVYVAEKEGYSAYLFTYFTGNSGTQEAIRFALSSDGYRYKALNKNQPILDSKTISSTGGVRDPHILRGKDGKTFYMVVTDMVSANGWSSNRAMVLLKSNNLTDWQSSVVNIQNTFSGYEDLLRVWAPQTIYDSSVGKYMIYWSMKIGNAPDKIYYAYANDNFTGLATEPELLFKNPGGGAVIDGDIVYKDGMYHLFFKTEGDGNGIKKAVSSTLTGNYEIIDRYLQSTTNSVEGGCVFRLIDSDTWLLIYDMYNNGAYQFTESADLEHFSVVGEKVSFDFTPRHGTIIPVTSEEATALMKKWGNAGDVKIQSSASKAVKQNNVNIEQVAAKIYLPVRYGTDLSSFDPEFVAYPGCNINPVGVQDFSDGKHISYTASVDGVGAKSYDVVAEVDNNPVLEGYYADPEILYSRKNKKFYIYPTSDGFVGWAGYYFKTFSSEDLVSWKDEGIILNLHTDVSWGTHNAWAPSIEEKNINGTYKYFYYFVAANNVGVAVADEPTGPFIDSGRKLASSIDPDVYTDTITGKSYLYWGNGTLRAAELNNDMVSINSATQRIITPTDGTFREGVYVIHRNDKYYFFWSENDTRSLNYRVRYGTSDSPLGPITIPSNNIVIEKDPSQGIYGTGHNSILQIPGRDEWYIVYHRFTRPDGIKMQGDSAGYFREVCIDKLDFNADGSVKQVQPTLEGIHPVKPGNVTNGMKEINNMDKPKVIKSGYYDLDGRRVKKKNLLNHRIYIEQNVYDNGTVSSHKIFLN